jgi:ElaB/YqjD/DUF883 family membrane-anchored ribosome-binding protein
MRENEIPGAAGPAIAAHSKDASPDRPKPRPAADAGHNGALPESLAALSERAHEGAERVKASVREMAGNARDSISGQTSRAADRAASAVREQPFVAMVLTGLFAMAIGVMLGRR